jgi:chaperone modulatory protein CbpM
MSTPVIYIADIDSSRTLFTLSEVCERCGVRAEIIVEMVEHGIVEPIVAEPENTWSFNIDALMRLTRAQRLRQDLELNFPGLALSLELLDKIDTLQQEVNSLKQQLHNIRGA